MRRSDGGLLVRAVQNIVAAERIVIFVDAGRACTMKARAAILDRLSSRGARPDDRSVQPFLPSIPGTSYVGVAQACDVVRRQRRRAAGSRDRSLGHGARRGGATPGSPDSWTDASSHR